MTQLLLRRDPLSLMDEVFNDFFNRAGVSLGRANELPASTLARLDVADQGDKFEIKVDLPGVKKDDINVSVEGARVTIAAEAKTQREKKDGERLIYSERRASTYARSFELPVEVTEEKAQARFEDGVLILALPKRAAVTSKRLEIR